MSDRVMDGIPQEYIIKDVVILRDPLRKGKFNLYSGLWHGAQVVIKTVHNEKAAAAALGSSGSQDMLVTFRGEMIKLGMQRHPHIITHLGVCPPQLPRIMTPGLVMECLFCTLGERLEMPSPFTELGEVRVASGIAAALEHLHGSDIIHRNVCSETIMLTSVSSAECVAKLCDFMLACKAKSQMPQAAARARPGNALQQIKDRMHEHSYLPPELLQLGAATALPATCQHDLYAFGATMAAMCTKREQLSAFTSPSQALEHMKLQNTPHSLLPVIGKCLHYDPAMRTTASNIGKILANKVDELQQKALAAVGENRLRRQQAASSMQSLERDLVKSKAECTAARSTLAERDAEIRDLSAENNRLQHANTDLQRKLDMRGEECRTKQQELDRVRAELVEEENARTFDCAEWCDKLEREKKLVRDLKDQLMALKLHMDANGELMTGLVGQAHLDTASPQHLPEVAAAASPQRMDTSRQQSTASSGSDSGEMLTLRTALSQLALLARDQQTRISSVTSLLLGPHPEGSISSNAQVNESTCSLWGTDRNNCPSTV